MALNAASHYVWSGLRTLMESAWTIVWNPLCYCCHLTHWGLVTCICVSEVTIIGSDNGLSPGRRQAIIWNNAGLLLIEPLGTNFSEISIGIQTFSFKKMHLNMSSAKRRPLCLGLNALTLLNTVTVVCVHEKWVRVGRSFDGKPLSNPMLMYHK